MNERTFVGTIERLRRPERVAALEVPRVTGLCLDDIAAASVLDLGCGSGIFSEAFCARGLFCAGVDLNAAMLRAARDFAPHSHLARGVSDLLPFPDASFDLVFMAHLLHEVDNPAITLGECRRVARKRIAVLEWPHRQENIGPPLAHRLSPEDVGAAASAAGLVRVRPVALKAMSLYLIDVGE
jgi:ubiquinone/menaquinone biosynthesis C-methylase UbiE